MRSGRGILKLFVVGMLLGGGLFYSGHGFAVDDEASIVVKELVDKGSKAIAAGQYDEAIACAEKIIRLNPDHAEAYNMRGVALFGKNDKELSKKAIEDFDKAIKLKPDFPVAYTNRGNAKTDLGLHDSNIDDQNRALTLSPNYAKAYAGRGTAYDWKEEYARAIADFSRALELEPNDFSAYRNRGNSYYKKNEYVLAIKDFDRAIQLRPDKAELYWYRARAYLKIGELDAALADANRSLEMNPKRAIARFVRAEIRLGKKDFDGAIEDYTGSLESNLSEKYLDAAYFGRGKAYKAKGLFSNALSDFRKAAELKPDNKEYAKEIKELEENPNDAAAAVSRSSKIPGAAQAPAQTQKEIADILVSQLILPSDREQTVSWKDQVKVTLPAGLVDNKQTLTIATTPDISPHQFKGLNQLAAFDISLGNLHEFKKELTIEMGYDPSKILSEDSPKTSLVAARWDTSQKTWQTIPVQVDTQRKVAILRVDHLSRIGLFYLAAGYGVRETDHFTIIYDRNARPTVAKAPQDPAGFAKQVGEYLEHAWTQYHGAQFPRPFAEFWKVYEVASSLSNAALLIDSPRTVVFIDQNTPESETNTVIGNVNLKFNYDSLDEVRHDSAHELFHRFQMRAFNISRYTARHWWLEATADYAADKIAWGGLGTMSEVHAGYFRAPLTTVDQIHEYDTAQFIEYLVRKGVNFKEMWDESVAAGNDPMSLEAIYGPRVVQFLEGYVKRTASTLREHYRGFVEYLLFDASSPLEVIAKSLLSSGVVETDPAPKVLAADKSSISYTFSLGGGYTAKLWGFKVAGKDPKSSSPRALTIKAGKIPDVDASVYVPKNDQRLQGGVEADPAMYKGTINSNKQSLSLSVAQDAVVYILAVNTGASGQSLTVKVSDEFIISPPTASVEVGKNVTFTIAGVTAKVLWTVQEGDRGGTFSSEGVYTAPDKAGTYNVVAMLESDRTQTDTATVKVKEAPMAKVIWESLPSGWTVSDGGLRADRSNLIAGAGERNLVNNPKFVNTVYFRLAASPSPGYEVRSIVEVGCARVRDFSTPEKIAAQFTDSKGRVTPSYQGTKTCQFQGHRALRYDVGRPEYSFKEWGYFIELDPARNLWTTVMCHVKTDFSGPKGKGPSKSELAGKRLELEKNVERLLETSIHIKSGLSAP